MTVALNMVLKYAKKKKTIFNLNFLSKDKIVDSSNLKVFVDCKIYVTEKLKFVFGRVENILGKGEKAGYQHYLLFP